MLVALLLKGTRNWLSFSASPILEVGLSELWAGRAYLTNSGADRALLQIRLEVFLLKVEALIEVGKALELAIHELGVRLACIYFITCVEDVGSTHGL